MSPYIRWMVRSDLAAVLGIEAAMHRPWTEDQLLQALRSRDTIGYVAVIDETVIGHVVYVLEADRINVLRFAVDPAWRWHGFGRAMLSKLRLKLSPFQRSSLRFIVPESASDMHGFLKASGVRATRLIRGAFGDEDGYEFVDRFAAVEKAVTA